MGPGKLSYTILREEGPDHRKNFLSRVEWNGLALGEGVGSSKKEAETAAAAAALESASVAQLCSTPPVIT